MTTSGGPRPNDVTAGPSRRLSRRYKAGGGRYLSRLISRTAIPVSRSLANELAAHVSRGSHLLAGADGGQLSPAALEHAVRRTRTKVDGLPAGFRYHDLRHYFASLLIASGADVKTVQARLRHASAKTTLDTYGHLWPGRDESTRAAVEAVFTARADSLAAREA